MKTTICLFAVVYLLNTTVDSSTNKQSVCSVEKLRSSKRLRIPIEDFKNNSPKSHEEFRIVSMFTRQRPILGLQSDKGGIYYFGRYKNDSSFAIYKTHSDWLHDRAPCDVVYGKPIFASRKNVVVEIILAKGK